MFRSSEWYKWPEKRVLDGKGPDAIYEELTIAKEISDFSLTA
jgi:hypothetical protein